MNVWGITDRGVIRTQNQDAFAHQVLPDGRVVALVCDGMGGAKAGNVASSMAVDIFMREFLQDEGRSGLSDRSRMERPAATANEQVFRRAVTEPDCAGMGTTMVAALVEEGQALILNEGDSRAYHLSEEGGIVRVTRDHSLVEDLVERGELTPDQARTHPHKNLITRALGADPELRADLFRQKLNEGDFLLLWQRRAEQCGLRAGDLVRGDPRRRGMHLLPPPAGYRFAPGGAGQRDGGADPVLIFCQAQTSQSPVRLGKPTKEDIYHGSVHR